MGVTEDGLGESGQSQSCNKGPQSGMQVILCLLREGLTISSG